MTDKFILGGIDGKEIIPCPNLFAWGRWFEKVDRHIAKSGFRVWMPRTPKVGGYRKAPKRVSVWISTVFLGMDHRYFSEGPPILFETMVFFDRKPYKGHRRAKKAYDDYENYMQRYHTWDEAEKGHQVVCDFIARKCRKN